MGIIDNALNNPDQNEAIIAINEYLNSRFYRDPSSISEFEKDVIYVENLEREVNNGGFSQFFYNSSGDYTYETLTALERIGAKIVSGLLQSAIEVFPDKTVPKDREIRQNTMEKIENVAEDIWSELDNKFYAYPENITGLVIEYIRNNRKEFK